MHTQNKAKQAHGEKDNNQKIRYEILEHKLRRLVRQQTLSLNSFFIIICINY